MGVDFRTTYLAKGNFQTPANKISSKNERLTPFFIPFIFENFSFQLKQGSRKLHSTE